MKQGEELKDLNTSIWHMFIEALILWRPMLAPMNLVASAGEVAKSAADIRNAMKIDRFIWNIDRNEKAAEKFRMCFFEGPKKDENAQRLLHDIFLMETDRKVDCLSYAAINFSNEAKREVFSESDFFRTGFVLTNTLSEDLEFLHQSDLDQEYEYNENVQGLVSAGLMYMHTEDKYKFTPFAKKLDQFALDLDGRKYGIDLGYAPLPDPVMKVVPVFG